MDNNINDNYENEKQKLFIINNENVVMLKHIQQIITTIDIIETSLNNSIEQYVNELNYLKKTLIDNNLIFDKIYAMLSK